LVHIEVRSSDLDQIVRSTGAPPLTQINKMAGVRAHSALTRLSRMNLVATELPVRQDIAAPRYTCYPMSERFVEAFTAADYGQALSQRHNGPAALAKPLSLYVHIPFCESLCYFCSCNKIITRQHQRSAQYLRCLACEVDLITRSLGSDQAVTQLHLGGGTPTFLSDDELRQLLAMLGRSFAMAPAAELSIEVDPRTVDAARLQVLADLGFSRLSFGVQDLDEQVLKAVHRPQPAAKVLGLIESARAIGFDAITVDLIYGLPRQTPETFADTLGQIAQLRPDGVTLHGYAHLPERFRPQRRIVDSELPGAAARQALLTQATTILLGAGYVHLGAHHFSLPNDALTVARRQGRMHRGFQGYSTHPDCDLVGLGVSAISRIGAAYAQNAPTLDEYGDCLGQGRLPVTRGLALTRDDLVRRAVIMALMCQGHVVFESIELAWLIDFRSYFARELEQLRRHQAQGLVFVDDAGIQLTSRGWFSVPDVSMEFDRYLQADRNRAQFSRII
jgi:oxygen-independent coproporphyrinogen-3 oxidase